MHVPHSPLSWSEFARRTVRETIADDGFGLAAQLAYYFVLSLFPALLGLIALASFFPLVHVSRDLLRLLDPIAPSEVIDLIRTELQRIANGDRAGLLSVGVAGALWSSSTAMTAIIDVMNHAYELRETRAWWRVRARAIVLTIGLAAFVLVSITLVLAGPELADLVGRLGAGAVVAWMWKVGQWPLVFVLVAAGMAAIYLFGPDARQRWTRVVPGAISAAALWLIGSLGFRFYVVNFGAYATSYGAIGAVIVLLLWFYLLALAIVVGAEVNAAIEHASPLTNVVGTPDGQATTQS